jgi:hypothetical protein
MEKKQAAKETKQSDLTVAQQIWEDIKDKQINMFALPGQTVSQYCEPVLIEPSKCYLSAKVSAVLPALEEALKGLYLVERIDRFVVVEKIVDKYAF